MLGCVNESTLPPPVSSMVNGEVREIPGMGTFIETSHHDGTITR